MNIAATNMGILDEVCNHMVDLHGLGGTYRHMSIENKEKARGILGGETYLVILDVNGQKVLKYGYSYDSMNSRIPTYKYLGLKPSVVFIKKHNNILEASKYEWEIHKKNAGFRINLNGFFDGHNECFSKIYHAGTVYSLNDLGEVVAIGESRVCFTHKG